MKRTESCLQVQVVGHRDELEIVRRFEREMDVASGEKRRTIIRYDRAATLKPTRGRRMMLVYRISCKKDIAKHLVTTPRLTARRISVFNILSVLLTNSVKGEFLKSR